MTKDPDATLPYDWNWAPWLATGDTITAHTITIDTPGLTINSHAHTPTTVIAWLSGGTVGVTYNLTCHITTVSGMQDDRTRSITIRNR